MISPVVTGAAMTTLNFVSSLVSRVFKYQNKVNESDSSSLIQYTKSTRVEPIVLIDERIANMSFIKDVMLSLNSLFIGYYLQAVALAVNVGRVNVVKLLDALNPNRDINGPMSKLSQQVMADSRAIVGPKLGLNSAISAESYKYGLPTPGETFGMEAFGVEATDLVPYDAKKDPSFNMNESNFGFGDKLKNVYEDVNLSVGKLVEVTIEDSGKKATFPVMVRLISTIMQSDVLSHILGDGSRNVTLRERFHGWRSGQLEFWRDLVLATDLIDEHRKALIKDKSGVYEEILKRRSGNRFASVMTDVPSIGTASNLVVLAKRTAQELEKATGGRLSDAKFREKVFASTYIMIMVVVDPDYEQVTFYHRGIALPTVMSARELKSSNKGTGPDVADILKAYQLGNSPNI